MIERDAVISDCSKYRYLLKRAWDYNKLRALVVMLNPSTADAYIDDPTIKSLIRLLSPLGFGSFEVINLFAYRATNPNDLLLADDLVGPKNQDICIAAISRCDIAICAWGNFPVHMYQCSEMLTLIRRYRPAAYCFSKTKSGMPKHPLYIKTGTQLETYR